MFMFDQQFHQKCWFGKMWNANIPAGIPAPHSLGKTWRLTYILNVFPTPIRFLSFVFAFKEILLFPRYCGGWERLEEWKRGVWE